MKRTSEKCHRDVLHAADRRNALSKKHLDSFLYISPIYPAGTLPYLTEGGNSIYMSRNVLLVRAIVSNSSAMDVDDEGQITLF